MLKARSYPGSMYACRASPSCEGPLLGMVRAAAGTNVVPGASGLHAGCLDSPHVRDSNCQRPVSRPGGPTSGGHQP